MHKIFHKNGLESSLCPKNFSHNTNWIYQEQKQLKVVRNSKIIKVMAQRFALWCFDLFWPKDWLQKWSMPKIKKNLQKKNLFTKNFIKKTWKRKIRAPNSTSKRLFATSPSYLTNGLKERCCVGADGGGWCCCWAGGGGWFWFWRWAFRLFHRFGFTMTCKIWEASKAVPGNNRTGDDTWPASTHTIFGYSSSPKSGVSRALSIHGFQITEIIFRLIINCHNDSKEQRTCIWKIVFLQTHFTSRYNICYDVLLLCVLIYSVCPLVNSHNLTALLVNCTVSCL